MEKQDPRESESAANHTIKAQPKLLQLPRPQDQSDFPARLRIYGAAYVYLLDTSTYTYVSLHSNECLCALPALCASVCGVQV